MKIILLGEGRMGQLFLKNYSSEIVNSFSFSKELSKCNDNFDVIVDFSHHNNIEQLLSFALKKKKPLLIGTTGFTKLEKEMIEKASKEIPIALESNYSLGITQLKKAIIYFIDTKVRKIIITETHHIHKKDMPSGTALDLKEYLLFINPKLNIDIVCHRVGEVKGIHEVEIIKDDEIITLTHEALNREVFVKGSYKSLQHLISKEKGLFTMKELIYE